MGCRLAVALGGPNVYVNTREGEVQGYWGSDRASAWLPSEICEEINAIFTVSRFISPRQVSAAPPFSFPAGWGVQLSMCSVPGILGYRVAPGLLCGVAVPLCVTSSCLRCHSSIGNAYMHPRFSAIFSDFSRFSVHRQCLSHSISLFRIFSRFFILLLLGGLCGLSRAGERGRMTGEGMGHCASVSLSVPLSCVSGGGVLYLPSPRSLAVWGFLGASCVICEFSWLPAPVPVSRASYCPSCPSAGISGPVP